MATLKVALDAKSFGSQLAVGVTRPLAAATRGAAKFDSAVNRSERTMKRASVTASRFKSQLAGLFGVFAAFRAVSASAKLIGEFEERIVLLGAVSGATSQQLEELEKTARAFGASTRFTASEAAEGLLFLARAGFSVNDSIAALPSTLNLAQVGMISLGQAADFASNIVAQFGLAAEETSRVVDSLVIASNRANTSVSQAAEAMKFAGTVLGQLGIQVETTANLIGVLGDRGIQASQAGTNLRAVFLKLQAPTTAGAAAMKRFGLSVSDVDFRTNDVADVFERLRPLLRDTSAAVDIFGIRNVSAAQTISLSTDRLRELAQAQRDNVGEAERVARAVDDTLVGAFKNMTAAVQEGVLQLGDAGLGQSLRSTVDLVTDVIRIMTGMTNAQNQASQQAQILQGVLFALGEALQFLAFAAVTTRVVKFIAAVKAGVLLTGKFGAALAFLSGPVGLLAVAIFGAAARIGIYSNQLVEASNETRRLATETLNAQTRIVSGLGGIERAAFDLKRAIEFDDDAGQVAALNTQAKLLETQFFELSKEAEKADKAIRSLTDAEREQIGVGAGFDANAQAQFLFKDIAKVLPESAARELAISLGSTFEQAIKSSATLVSRDAYIEALDTAVRGLREAAKAKQAERIEIPTEIVLTADEKAAENAFDTLLELGKALQFETDTAGKTADEVKRLRFEHDLLKLATDANIFDAERLTAAWVEQNNTNIEANRLAEERRQATARQQAEDERTIENQKRIREQGQQALADLKFETTLIGLTNIEREKAIFLRQLEGEESGRTAEEIALLNEQYAQQLDLYDRLDTRATESAALRQQLESSINDTLRGGLEDLILDFDNLEATGKRVFEELIRAAVRAQIAEVFGPAGSGGGAGGAFAAFLGFAGGGERGLAFGTGGSLLPGFERGGLISESGLMPSAAGLRPVAESEPEAVMPLRRTAGGRLGIEVANPDAGGQGKAAMNFTMNVNGVKDAESFGRNRRQIQQGMQRMLNSRGV